MNFLTQILPLGFGSCLNCGSLDLRCQPVCNFCYNWASPLEQRKKQIEMTQLPRCQKRIQLRWVVSWQNQREAWISRWARSLKGYRQGMTWSLYAQDFTEAQGQELLDDSLIQSEGRMILLISPSVFVDHAFLWTKALAQELGSRALFFPWLEKNHNGNAVPHKKQKQLTLQERSSKKLELRPEFQSYILENSRKYSWIFVDDIWTTGATAEAVYEALGHPPHYQALVFFRRFL